MWRRRIWKEEESKLWWGVEYTGKDEGREGGGSSKLDQDHLGQGIDMVVFKHGHPMIILHYIFILCQDRHRLFTKLSRDGLVPGSIPDSGPWGQQQPTND